MFLLLLLHCVWIELFMLITIPVCVCRLRTRVLKFLLSWRRYSLTLRTSQHPLSSSRLRENMSCPFSIYKQYSFIPFKFLSVLHYLCTTGITIKSFSSPLESCLDHHPSLYRFLKCTEPGAYEHREAARRSVKLPYIVCPILCRISRPEFGWKRAL